MLCFYRGATSKIEYSFLGSDLLADVGVSSCPNDYVLIRSSSYTINGESGTGNTFCGLGFPSEFTCKLFCLELHNCCIPQKIHAYIIY